MTTPPATSICPICAGSDLSLTGSACDYVAGRPARAIVECASCRASFADDRSLDQRLYDAIYRHAAVLPGYRRYVQFARLVDRSDRGLEQLAELEPSYEAIVVLLAQVERPRRVLELGCGLGYTTAALRKRGLDAVGADIAADAVATATARYGDHYRLVDPDDPPSDWIGAFDLVVATEVLEHLPEPLEFLRYATKFLAPGGRMLVTTPNKDAWETGTVWATDSPPVHLHWMSRSAVSTLGERAGCEVSFLDLAPRRLRPSTALGLDHVSEALLTADFEPVHTVPWTAKVGSRLRDRPKVYGVASKAVSVARHRNTPSGALALTSDTIAAVFSPRPAT